MGTIAEMFSDLLEKPCHKNKNHAKKRGRPLNRKDAKYAKFKTRSRCIVQNRDTVWTRLPFNLPYTRQMKKTSCLPLRPLRLE